MCSQPPFSVLPVASGRLRYPFITLWPRIRISPIWSLPGGIGWSLVSATRICTPQIGLPTDSGFRSPGRLNEEVLPVSERP